MPDTSEMNPSVMVLPVLVESMLFLLFCYRFRGVPKLALVVFDLMATTLSRSFCESGFGCG